MVIYGRTQSKFSYKRLLKYLKSNIDYNNHTALWGLVVTMVTATTWKHKVPT